MASRPQPKYLQTKQKLIRMITRGDWPAGSRFPSEAQLLRQFEVSRPTLVRSLNDLVREGYLLRRQGKGTFVADRVDTRATQTLVFFMEDLALQKTGDAMHVLNPVLEGLEDAAEANNARVQSCGIPADPSASQINDLIERTNPIAAVVYLPTTVPKLIESLARRSLPVWGIAEPLSSGKSVYIDEQQSAYIATKYLIEKGCRRIALLNGMLEMYWGFAARETGYKQALEEAGLKVAPKLITHYYHVLESESGRSMMQKLLREKAQIDGVFAVTDRKAMGAIAQLQEAGVKVQEEVLITSMDDTLAQRSEVPLPAVHCPFREMAQHAGNMAMREAANKSTSVQHAQIRLESWMVDRLN